MYVTRPLSLYKRDPAALSLPPPEGPNSGYLVLLDEESITTCCFGLCTNTNIRHLPFPQNKNLSITYTESSADSTTTDVDKVLFVPVLNQPLSSNQYYVIRREGKHQGEASASSTEEDKGTCLCFSYIKDVKPKAFEQTDPYQQFEIIRKRYGFYAKPVGDGFPPLFLRRKGWNVYYTNPDHYHLDEALGLNASLRARMPDFNFPVANYRSRSVLIGNWYCPFIFVKEELKLKDQMKMSSFYEMTLEQRWDKIFEQHNINFGKSAVPVDVGVEREVVTLGGKEEAVTRSTVADGFLWFRSVDCVGGEGNQGSVGLSLAIVERMQWEQKRVGWVSGNEKEVRIEKVEEYRGIGEWKRFGCYVLVESFVLRRMDGSVVLNYEFKHTHQIRCKWE